MTAAGNELASYMADPEAYDRMNPSAMESVVGPGGTIGVKEKGANDGCEDNGRDGLSSAVAEAGTNAGNFESSSSIDTSGPNADTLEDRPSVDTGPPAGDAPVGDAEVRYNPVGTLQVAGSSPDLRGEVTKRANRTGRVTIECTPSAVVYVNGDSVGITPFTNPISLAAGRHQIEFRNPTFPAHQVSVEVVPGETRRMTVSLWDHVGELTV